MDQLDSSKIPCFVRRLLKHVDSPQCLKNSGRAIPKRHRTVDQ